MMVSVTHFSVTTSQHENSSYQLIGKIIEVLNLLDNNTIRGKTVKYAKEQFEAYQKYMKLAVEFEKLWLEASKTGFVNIKPLEEWRDKHWTEEERLRKIAFAES
jgi:hypothetical protein